MAAALLLSSRSLSWLISVPPIAALLAPAACRSEATGQSAPPAPAVRGASASADGAKSGPAQAGGGGAGESESEPEPPPVLLLEPGKEPRTTLRYTFSPSGREKMGITTTMAMQMGMAGQNVRMQLPPIHMEMELSVAEQLSDQKVRCKFAVTGADVLPGGDKVFDSARLQLVEQLRKTVGAAGTAVVTNRGMNRKMDLNLPAYTDPQMRQAMESGRHAAEQLSSPLPEEPVGIGAKWQVDQLIEQNGLKLKQTLVYELVAFEGRRGELKSTIAQTADPQVASLPNLPAGYRAELLSHTGAGTSTIEIDLGRLAPTSSTGTIHTETSLKVSGQGQDQTMEMKADTKVEINRI